MRVEMLGELLHSSRRGSRHIWSCSQVGHPRSHNFFVLIKADDEERMAEHTEAMMWDCELRTAGSVAHLRVPSC